MSEPRAAIAEHQTNHYVAALVCAGSLLVVLGSAGSIPLDGLDLLALHHAFHVALPLAAFGIFAAHVARDIVRHGWPAFSWRLNG